MQEDFFPGYAIAKSGVEGITRTLGPHLRSRQRAGQHGLAGLGCHRASADQVVEPRGRGGNAADQALKRRIYPAEFAQMVLFLAADDGAACTAQQFLVDGGRR